jgi:hypothetical protein
MDSDTGKDEARRMALLGVVDLCDASALIHTLVRNMVHYSRFGAETRRSIIDYMDRILALTSPLMPSAKLSLT